MNKIFINNDIIHTNNIIAELSVILRQYKHQKILILTDDNCKKYCYPIIKNLFNENTLIFEIPNGEQNKSINTVKSIWDYLILHNFNRNSLLVNLGGGVLTDIGGFAASTFKRGLSFINIPTTLLAQIDASVGGKTGINYGGLKNEIGVFSLPDKVIISQIFLNTLDEREFLSGFSEMIKHALIYDQKHLKELQHFIKNDFTKRDFKALFSLIKESVKIKEQFVKRDVKDKGIRKVLNFGHTFGHAFESYFNDSENQKIKHGEAVAFGMICELFISSKKVGLSKNLLNELTNYISSIYGNIKIPENDFKKIVELMKHDKKNISSEINCVLLKAVKKPVFDKTISENDAIESLLFLNNSSK